MLTPPSSLTDQQLATLHARFVVPIAVQMILNDREQLDEECEYALHECLSDLPPDTALLCLALCGQIIAAKAEESPVAAMLGISCSRIANEYGAALLAECDDNERLSDRDALILLHQVPEDLEELAALLDAALSACDPHSSMGLLCDILSIEALVQNERACHRLMELSFLSHATKGRKRTLPRHLERLDENVIVFPR